MEDESLSILDYCYIWLKWRRVIMCMIVVTCLLATGVSLLLPVTYRATTTILPPKRDKEAGLAASLGTLSAGLDILGLNTTQELDTYMTILDSRNVRARIIDRFHLQSAYHAVTMDEALAALKDNVEIELTKENAINLSVIDHDRLKVAEITNAFVEELDRVNKTLSAEQAKQNRQFIGGRVDEAQQQLLNAEEALTRYQEQHHTLALSEESRSALLAGAELEARTMALEVERTILRRTLGATHPALLQMDSELDASRQRLSDLPQVGLALARLFREVEIQTRLLKYLVPQYEQARIQEARDTPTVQIVDIATVPQRKYAPKRMLIVLGAGVSSLLVGLWLTVMLESLARARADGTDRGRRIERVLGELRKLFHSS